MKLARFFEKFEQLADAPNSMAKMRELVLDLAVQGKLFSTTVANNWFPMRLGEVVAEGLSSINPADSPNKMFELWSVPSYASGQPEILTGSEIGSTKRELPDLSILLGKINPHLNRVWKVARRTRHTLIASPEWITIVPGECWDSDYLARLLTSPTFNRDLCSTAQGMGSLTRASTKKVAELVIRRPPLAEQKRIVAKVNELMALCDRLEAQQQERDTRHATLARASLARFAEAPTPANLDFLFHKSYAITPADLRKSILTLAVQGQLVTQDPNDQPAASLLERIEERRERLIATKHFRRSQLPTSEINEPFSIPETWEWAHLGNAMLNVTDGFHSTPKATESGVPYVTAKHVKPKLIDFKNCLYVSPEDFEEISSKTRPTKGDVLVVNIGAGCGWPAIIDVDFEFAFKNVAILNRPDEVDSKYLFNYLLCLRDEIFEERTKGGAQPFLSLGLLREIPFPLPPLAEQRRIVAKVDQLMALVDQLEVQLAEAKVKSAALLDAVIHELLNPSAKVIDLTSYRAAIGCYAIGKMKGKRYFGRTTAMKVLYFAQAHVGLELKLQPMREAAGPLDSWIYRFEEEGVREGWFKSVTLPTANGKTKIEYRPGGALAEKSAQAERIFTREQRKEFDRLLALFAARTTEEAEIIATLFAAWNDFLIDGHMPSDDEIVTEVREHWHEKKGRFSPTQLRQWLGWLRQNKLVPQGRLPHTQHQPQLSLN